ncbi:MAG: hypothetical protein A2751_04475 [Candidatus Doudnabacteria bacterium RIFCSPHIGHO2_01_FULL_46_14]|uniref:ATP-grasp domain-containing protein n=1 Tax=Candidatus Doudnabacteria bacterium RIFCSPHIGHO2_01_FULL_46_14 TaxID=1817824 RepID=A0A1F5NPB8_9BACT|nr:MAG: hypothetical protein A2751_04475 [Candidatus Doudnabacteria bacterium RIFCSPHIGHO2_01_FULL_46_14]
MNYCPYCLPTKRKSHWDLHADYYMEKVRRTVMWPVDFLARLLMPKSDWLWGKLLGFFAMFGIVKFVAEPPDEEILNRSLIIMKEAKKRGIEIEAIKIAGGYKNEYRYRLPNPPTGGWRYFEANPLADETRGATDHKFEFKKLMQGHGIPVPAGGMFTRQRRASRYAKSLGFPVVVKPATGSLGYHSTYQIQNEADLLEAMKIARQYRPDFIVEKHISGDNFRATVIGKRHVFVCGKDRSNVVGDGRSTIEQLIDEKNSDPRRGEYEQKNFTLHKIPKANQTLLGNLREQGLSLDSIPATNQKIYFYKDFLPGTGIDFINVTEQTHPANIALFLRAAHTLDTDLVGFDAIAEDISRPHHQQTFAILEGNTIPYLDMHQFPSHGTPSDVAKIVWDIILENLV